MERKSSTLNRPVSPLEVVRVTLPPEVSKQQTAANACPAACVEQFRERLTRLKVLPGLLVLVATFGVGYLANYYYGLPDRPAVVATSSGLQYEDLVIGQGASPQAGQRIVVHYKGFFENGQEFENSYKFDRPANFILGPGLIKGWQEGVMTMKVGGKRRLIIPPHLAYGSTGSGLKIPPDATLIFDVELLGIN
jgi:hypothetical protein